MKGETKSESGQLSEVQKSAWHNFLIAHAKITREIDRRLVQAGHHNLDVYDVLVTLEFEKDRKLRMSELADRKAFSRSGLTRLVDRLEKQGLIERHPCLDDRRGYYAYLTDKGQSVRELAWPVFEEAMAELWGKYVSDRKADELNKLFTKLIAATQGE